MPPQNDEIEVVIIGPGYGECIVIHCGNNEWAIIDSCRFNGSKKPAALEYFESLKITPNVKLICATHWHDDHIRGLNDLLAEYPEAVLMISAALNDPKFTNLILKSPASRKQYRNESGISEIQTIYNELLQGKRHKKLAQINTDLYHNQENGFLIRAISPDDSITISSTLGLIEKAIENNPRAASIPNIKKPNDISVALQAKFGETSILLGADLETKGWKVSLNNAINLAKSGLYKVSHHGGESGHHDDIWSKALDNPISVVTPFRRGRVKLPANSDIERLLNSSSSIYMTTTGLQKAKKFSQDKYVKKSMEQRKVHYVNNEYGLVRLRKSLLSNDEWNVSTFGRAGLVTYNNIKDFI